jgi:hydroxymethylpyrimidine kinase/phosphomethylpyrimidine kinase/thiamine-phosphate diphosphorylase
MGKATNNQHPPIIWSIAGHDSSGGAGLSADQRAADALGVHLCPVVASITAQHSNGVEAVFAVPANQLEAQLKALAQDMPPAVIKTGLLGHVTLIEAVARWVDKLRLDNPNLALVVDPVLGASAGGAAFADDTVLWAYRRELLPRATLITPNRAEARRLLGLSGVHNGPQEDTPRLAARLREMGTQGVVITGGDAPHDGWAADWMSTPHAQGWLCAPRVDTPHHHGSGCTFASACASALAWGHTSADAIVMGKMVTHQALIHGHAAGVGAGPVIANSAKPMGPLPYLGLGHDLPWQLTHGEPDGQPLFKAFTPPADGLYGILPDSDLIGAAVQAGMSCLQLRHKATEGALAHIQASAHHCSRVGTTLFINDHWQLALDLPDSPALKLGLHLGQEDILAMCNDAKAQLLAARGRILLGLSSHCLWELARAAGCGASLIACGPVQATTTKDMPWRPQGEDNLRWWVAHSPAPVVAIGGLLTTGDLARFAACGPTALCIVRGLGSSEADMAIKLPALREAVKQGRAQIIDSSLAPISPICPHPAL